MLGVVETSEPHAAIELVLRVFRPGISVSDFVHRMDDSLNESVGTTGRGEFHSQSFHGLGAPAISTISTTISTTIATTAAAVRRR